MAATQLRHLRIDRGLTQLDLGQQVGISATRLSLLERRKATPKLDELARLAEALGVPAGTVLAESDSSAGSQRRLVQGGALSTATGPAGPVEAKRRPMDAVLR
jgi:transcriptional regulator with XRE-family HTH domain